jgi:2-polyprenyl-6-methoxyphenol hydroxylase-like FAD-dependent oxidoreductase
VREPSLPRRTDVLVIGAGPVGLVVSGLLSRRGIPNLVVERRRETQRAPAAHVIRRRPMEILDELGVGDEVRRAAPPLPLDYVTWCTTLGGEEIGRLDLRPRDPETGERRPEPWTHCAQDRLEPILLRAASRRPEARVVRGAECVELTQTGDAVATRIRMADGAEPRVEATWAIAADGAARPARGSLGIPMEGLGPLARFAMVHFAADLGPWIRERPGPIFWILNPESPGTLIVHDPARSHVFMAPRRGTAGEEEEIPARLAAALAVPVTPKILSVDHWSLHVQVARRYGQGRILLVGDAAHRFPPTGGLGLNTGLQEAAHLVGELARVRPGDAPEALLERYEAACRPAARANADESFENLKRLGAISRAIGEWPDLARLEQRLASLTGTERRQLDEAIEAQRRHFLSDGTLPGPEARPPATLVH